MWDFLDSASERGARAGETNGRQLHRALVDALDPQAPLSDYYRYHPWKNDGGYLRALVETCRRVCLRLPGYRQVQAVLLDGVAQCAIQAANHELNPTRRDTALRAWAARQPHVESTLSWFELTAAASAFAPHVLLALAAEPRCEPSEVAAVCAAYFPWMSLAIAMLDSYVDQAQDALNESHSYIAHYDSETVAVRRLAEIVERTVSEAGRLANGRRHVVIAAAMVAMYLSLPSANTAALRAHTRTVARAGGPLTRLLLALAHVWRAADGRRADAASRGQRAAGAAAAHPAAAGGGADLPDLARAVRLHAALPSPLRQSLRAEDARLPGARVPLGAGRDQSVARRAGRGASPRRGGSGHRSDRRLRVVHAAGRAQASGWTQSGDAGVASADRPCGGRAGARARAACGGLLAARRALRAAPAPARAHARGGPAASVQLVAGWR